MRKAWDLNDEKGLFLMNKVIILRNKRFEWQTVDTHFLSSGGKGSFKTAWWDG